MQLFEKACAVYGRELRNYIFTLTRNNDAFAAEEIYQNTMLEALTGLGYLRDSSKMKHWLFSIAKAESRRYYAAGRPGKSGDRRVASGGETAWPQYLFDFTKFIEDREYVKTLIDGLESGEQQLYILHYYYGLPLKEISEMLNVNYSTVRSMHVRGMTKMRKQSSRRQDV
jgi:RNA polymerase sigma factor (sigma-70 family)